MAQYQVLTIDSVFTWSIEIVLGIELIWNCRQKIVFFGIEYSKYGIALSVCRGDRFLFRSMFTEQA